MRREDGSLTMKNFIISIVIILVLITVFSVFGITGVFPPIGNYGTEYPGDSGVTMPGSGAEPAEIFSPEITPTQTQAEPAAAETQAPTEPPQEFTKENEPMNDMLLGLWHGVAAVLIGETAALIIATAILLAVIRKKKE